MAGTPGLGPISPDLARSRMAVSPGLGPSRPGLGPSRLVSARLGWSRPVSARLGPPRPVSAGLGRAAPPGSAVARSLADVRPDPLAPLLELPGVADGVTATRTSVDRLLNNRTLRRRSADVSAESSLRGARAAAALSGVDVALEDVRSGAAVTDPVLQGALRAYAAIPALADTWTHAPRQALARLHALAAADLVEDRDALGRPAGGAAERLDTLAAVLDATSAPAAVVAGIVHGELLSLDAFAPASGVVALAAVRLTLIDRGLDPKSLVVLEVGHRELGAAYPEALAGYRSGTPQGIGGWLTHCADAIVAGVAETTAICEAIARG